MDRFNPLKCKKLHGKATLPTRANKTDAGLDFYAISDSDQFIERTGHNTFAIRTGVAIEIPRGYVGLLFPRSSIYKKICRLSNSVGVIDEGYRGEVKFMFDVSEDLKPYKPKEQIYGPGEKIGQLVIVSNPKFSPEWVDELSESERGTDGFGSTGK